jgi:hypothetical protein
MNFKPTHIIKTEAGDTIRLMLVGEEAYMGHEWAESTIADYRFEKGTWTCKGKPAKIKAEAVTEEAVDEIEILK